MKIISVKICVTFWFEIVSLNSENIEWNALNTNQIMTNEIENKNIHWSKKVFQWTGLHTMGVCTYYQNENDNFLRIFH